MPLGAQGYSGLTASPPYFSPSQAIIWEPHLPAENSGSFVSCQPEAMLFLSESIGAHYLLICLAVYCMETLRYCRESAKS